MGELVSTPHEAVLIFTAHFAPLALLVFNTLDAIDHRHLPAIDLSVLAFAYMAAVIPALLLAGLDWKLSGKSTYLRVLGASVAGAAITGSMAFFLWDGFRQFFPALMSMLVGAFPAAICSGLSSQRQKGR